MRTVIPAQPGTYATIRVARAAGGGMRIRTEPVIAWEITYSVDDDDYDDPISVNPIGSTGRLFNVVSTSVGE